MGTKTKELHKLFEHLVEQVFGISITGEEGFYEIKVNLKNEFGFNYFIKIATVTWSPEGPIFQFVYSGSKMNETILAAIKSFNPNN